MSNITTVDQVFNVNGAKFTTSGNKVASTQYENMYFHMLFELALNRFKWDNVPSEIEPTIIEKSLLFNSLCVFFPDDTYGPYVALPGTPGAGLDIYGNPRSFTVTGMGGAFTRTMSALDCVPIWCNRTRYSELDIIRVYASILSEISLTIRTNTLQMRTPFIVKASEGQRLSAANVMRQIMEGGLAIYESDSMNPTDDMSVFNTSIHPDMVLNSQLYKQKAWNEAMTYLGINNANQDKAERLVADEVSANDSQVIACRMSALEARKIAADDINNRYGLDISVEWNTDIDAMRDMVIMSEVDGGAEGEGGEDESVHETVA